MERASAARSIARSIVRSRRRHGKKFTRATPSSAADALGSWLAKRVVVDGNCGFEVVERAPAFGARGVVATRSMEAGETVMRVPWTLVLESAARTEEDAAWSAGMGLELLERSARGASEPRRVRG